MGKKRLKVLTFVLAMAMACKGTAYAAPTVVPAAAVSGQVEQNIEKMDNQIEEIMSQIDDNKKQITQIEKDTADAESEIKQAQENLDEETNTYRDTIRAMYINGTSDYITLIFDAKGLSDLVSRIEMVEEIIENNKEVTGELIKSQKDVTARKKDMDSKKANLLRLQSDNEKKLDELNKDKDDETKLLAELKNQDNLYASNDEVYNETMKQIEQIQNNASNVSASRGTLAVSGNYIIAYAANFLGTKYVWGGTSPVPGFDCSGFTQYVFKHFGITLDRTTYEQINDGAAVLRDQLQPGDLVFFGTVSDPHHVGIYLGNGMYIHAPHTGDVVKISSLDRSDFVTGIRILQ
jgi:peptidoglycan DL-endopeptidase CwlO